MAILDSEPLKSLTITWEYESRSITKRFYGDKETNGYSQETTMGDNRWHLEMHVYKAMRERIDET